MKNDKKDVIDVEFQDIKNEIYITAPQLAKKINDTDKRVRYWAKADVFGKQLKIEVVNDRKRYKESDIPNFAFIKDLLDNKKFTHEQVRNHISKHGFKYAEYDAGLINTKDPLGFQALASALSLEVEDKLEKFTQDITEKNAEQLIKFLEHIAQSNLETKAEIESSVERIVSEKLDKSVSEFKSYVDEKERQATSRDIEMIDMLKNNMEERKKQQEELEVEKKKSFWGRLWGK
ncbi:TPA: MerR family transcriptional regulator [Clostridium botulinum]|nr:MerR family transcriptional regulator [Clostridium botulinum]HCL4455279.1 MerR family transcriptional regulator [Clostridium botulinum]